MIKKTLLSVVFLLITAVTSAHEFWLQPLSHTAAEGETIQVNWRVGMEFQGSTFVYLPNMATKVGFFGDETITALTPRFATKPALAFNAGVGTTIGITESTDFIVEYENLAAFEAFVEKEHLGDQYSALDNTATGTVYESYRRFAKTLISNPALAWQDTLVGHDFEWLLNRQDTELLAILYMNDQPAANYPVKLFVKSDLQSDNVTVFKAITDESGQVTFNNLQAGYLYLINAVKLRPTAAGDTFEEAHWHTDWASTTFQWQ